LLLNSVAVVAADFGAALADREVISDPDSADPIPMLLTADGYLLTRRDTLDPEADWNRAQRWRIEGDRLCSWTPGHPQDQWCSELAWADEGRIRLTPVEENDGSGTADGDSLSADEIGEYFMQLEPIDTSLRERSENLREMLSGRTATAEADGLEATVSFTADGLMKQDTPGGSRTMRWFVAHGKLCVFPAESRETYGQINIRVQCNSVAPTEDGFRLDGLRAGQPVEFVFQAG
jgi:hypothetical protein